MKYMILIYNDPALEPAYGTPAFDAMMAGFFAANQTMAADGVLVSGEGLQGVETATSLRIRGGKAETMDGPFATTKEHLGGYYVVDVADLDAALKYAALLPAAEFGTIEVRPLMNYNPAGN
ncbi:YciI family protein [Fertoebacter nigrum]|uniref:YciI family protein n=1 Tax=Fertoeibacter niger TaxID=2656921 RepID=A0A8X8GWP5_9RHOB|nr:YciI family protein [Fertoeibacter niger]NUB43258.1 YciI family protein [Fertoeibacter niger]